MAIVRAYAATITTADIADKAVTQPKIDLSSTDDTNLVLETTGTDTDKPPAITFSRASTTVADDMDLGKVSFRGSNSTPAEIEYVRVLGGASDVTAGSEGGEYYVSVMDDGALVEALAVGLEDGGTTFALNVNRSGVDLDLIVYGANVNNLLRTDAANDVVSIGTNPSAAGAIFQVNTTTRFSRPAPSMTTAQRGTPGVDGLANLAAGGLIYNTTTNKLQVYNGSTWIDLH